MTQEDKELLLKDLCARLPYGVKVNYLFSDIDNKTRTRFEAYADGYITSYHNGRFECDDYAIYLEDIKPYLRPMSSMTEEERVEMGKAIQEDRIEPWGEIKSSGVDNLLLCSCRQATNFINWLNAHHFDYRGLIEKGLALKAPEEMYIV